MRKRGWWDEPVGRQVIGAPLRHGELLWAGAVVLSLLTWPLVLVLGVVAVPLFLVWVVIDGNLKRYRTERAMPDNAVRHRAKVEAGGREFEAVHGAARPVPGDARTAHERVLYWHAWQPMR